MKMLDLGIIIIINGVLAIVCLTSYGDFVQEKGKSIKIIKYLSFLMIFICLIGVAISFWSVIQPFFLF